MLLKINNVEITEYPITFEVTVLDFDNQESSQRTADGTLQRDRIVTKRQIQMSWGVLEWSKVSSILQAMQDEFFTLYYPDTMLGAYATKTFYVGNRPALAALSKGTDIFWSGLSLTLIEQ